LRRISYSFSERVASNRLGQSASETFCLLDEGQVNPHLFWIVMMPFTVEQFLDVFAHYNLGVWPAQVVLTLLLYAQSVWRFNAPRISAGAFTVCYPFSGCGAALSIT
jgi:hypothetical protein